MIRSRFATPYGIACTLAILLGIIVRARPVLVADFPLNDGGLFYLMTAELQHTHFRLPAFTTYNAAHIPFAYSPLGFYVAGALGDAASSTLLHVVQFLPLVVTCATLGAFLLLARDMLSDRVAVVAALVAFALVPRSFIWLVMGGGLTRSFGFLFTILALQQAYLFFMRQRLAFAVAAGIFAGLTPMSHLGTAPFLAASLVLFFLAHGRHRRGVLGLVLIGVIAIAVSAPWWGEVIRVHGLGPFMAARGTGESILTPGVTRRNAIGRLARFGAFATGEPLFPFIGVLAVLGSLGTLRRGMLSLPIWWVLTLALDVRAGATYATVPASLLAGIGVVAAIRPLFVHRCNAFATAVAGFFVVYCTFAAMTRDTDLGAEAATLTSVSSAERDPMRWVASNTPPGSRFFVVPEVGWPTDKVAEWFPVIAERQSVATVQGTEWLPNGVFARSVALYRPAEACGGRTTACLDHWVAMSGAPFTHVFIPRARRRLLPSTERKPAGRSALCTGLRWARRRDLRAAPGGLGPPDRGLGLSQRDGGSVFCCETRRRTNPCAYS